MAIKVDFTADNRGIISSLEQTQQVVRQLTESAKRSMDGVGDVMSKMGDKATTSLTNAAQTLYKGLTESAQKTLKDLEDVQHKINNLELQFKADPDNAKIKKALEEECEKREQIGRVMQEQADQLEAIISASQRENGVQEETVERVKSIGEQYNELTASVAATNKELNDSDKKIRSLDEKMRSLQDPSRQESRAFDNMNAAIEELQKIKKETADYASLVEDSQGKVDDLTSRIAELKKQKEDLYAKETSTNNGEERQRYIQEAAAIEETIMALKKKLEYNKEALSSHQEDLANSQKAEEAQKKAVERTTNAYVNKKQAREDALNDTSAKLAKEIQSHEQINKALDDQKAKLGEVGKKYETQVVSVDNLKAKLVDMLKQAAAMGGITIGLAGIKSFFEQCVNVHKEMEALHYSMNTLLGDAQKGDQMFNELREFAAKTPLQLKDLAAGAQTMLGFNIEAEKVIPMLKAIGDISMGDGQKLQSLTLAFSQMSATGKLMGQDLLQMINAGFNPLTEISRKTGESVADLKEKMSKGAISVEMVTDAFLSATQEGGKFYGMLLGQGEALVGMKNTMQGALNDMYDEIGTKLMPVVQGSIELTTTLAQNWEKVGAVIVGVVSSYGFYKGAVLTMTAVDTARIGITKTLLAQEGGRALAAKLTTVEIIKQTAATKLLALAQAALNAINPYAFIATTVVALGAALVYAATTTEDAAKAQERYNKAFDGYGASVDEAKNAAQSYLGVIRDTTKSEVERYEAWKKMQSEFPELVKGFTMLQIANMSAADATDLLNKSMERQMKNDIVSDIEKYQKRVDELNEKIAYYNEKDNNGNLLHVDTTGMMSRYQKELEKILPLLQAAKDKLLQIDEARAAFNDSQIDIDVKIQEAEDNIATMEKMKGWMDKMTESMQFKVEGKIDEEQMNKSIDEVEAEVQKAIDDTQSKLLKNPLSFEARMEMNTLEDVKKKIEKARSDFKLWGYDVMKFSLQYDPIASGEAIEEARGDLLRLQGQKEADTKKPKLTKEEEKEREKAAKEAAEQKKKQLQQQQKLQDLIKKQTQQNERERIELARNTEQAEINILEDSSEKKRRQIELDYKKQLDSIRKWEEDLKNAKIAAARQKWEAEHPNAKTTFENSSAYKNLDLSLSKEELEYIRQSTKAAEKVKVDSIEKITKANIAASAEYLKAWGNAEQQRAAISIEYQQQIDDAIKEGRLTEAMNLSNQMEKALSDFDFKEFQDDINWEYLFSELDNISIEYLEELKRKLKDALSVKDITAENAQILSERLQDVSTKLVEKKNSWASLFSNSPIANKIVDIKVLKERLNEANELLKNAQERQAKNQGELFVQQSNIQNFLKENGHDVKLDEINSGNADKFAKLFTEDNEGLGKITKMFQNLSGAESNLASSTEALGAAQGEAAGAASAAGGGMAGTVAMIDTIIHGINDNVQSFIGVMKELSIEDTKFGEGMSKFAESSQYATDAWESLKSGNVMGVAEGVLGSLRTLGEALGEWGIAGMGSSDTNLLKDMELLATSNKNLENAVSELDKTMKDANAEEAKKTLEKQKEYTTQTELGTQDIMRRAGAAYSNGFWGIGGTKSSNSHINDALNANDWSRISQIVGRSVRGASDFWELTSKEMYDVFIQANDLYSLIQSNADDGYQDASQYMDGYIKLWQQLEDEEINYYDRLTNMSFDSMKDNLRSALMDMNKSVEEFSDEFTENLMTASIENKFSEEGGIYSQLEAWRKAWGDAMQGGITTEEKEILQKQYEDIVALAQEQRDVIADTIGYVSNSSIPSFDKVREQFNSLTTDMTKTAEDFSKEFADLMYNALVESKLKDAYNDQIKSWYQQFKEASKNGLDEDAIAKLREEYNSIITNMNNEAKALAEIAGKDLTESKDTNGFDSVKSDFMSLIKNMDSTADDFAKSFETKLSDALIKSKVEDALNDDLKAWHKKLTELTSADHNLTEDEIASLRQEYIDLANGAKESADELKKITGEWEREMKTKIVGLSFDNLKNNFKKAVSDMKKTAKDFGDDLKRTIYEAKSNKNFDENYATQIETLYNDLYVAVNKGTDATGRTVDEILAAIETIYNESAEASQKIAESLGMNMNDLKAAISGISFSELEGGFNKVIGDMTLTSEDFASDFSQMMFNAIMKAQLANVWEEQLQTVYDDMYEWFSTPSAERSQEDYESIKSNYIGILTEIQSFGEEVEKITGYQTSAQKTAIENAAKEAEEAAKKAAEEAEKAAEEARKAWEERFADIENSFNNVLGDMSRDVDDFKKSLQEVSYSKMLDKAMESSINGELEAWYNRYESWLNKGADTTSAEFAKLMEDYEALGKKASDIADAIAESLGIENLDRFNKKTATTFDNLKSSFLSTISDMNSSAANFAENFTNMIQSALINAQMQDLLDENLAKWYKNFGQAMDDGKLNDEELSALRSEYDDLVEDALTRREAILGIIGNSSAKTQQGGSTAFQGMNQQTGDELNGRFTALQIAGESINANVANIANNIASYVAAMTGLSTNGVNQNEALQEIRDMMVINNLHLEDIARYAKLSYADFGMKLDTIANRLNRL